jgi:mannosyltransferase
MALIADQGPRSTRLLLSLTLLVTCLGAAWRFSHLGADSFWLDEMITVRDARAGLDAMYGEVDHPPLLHVLAYVITRATGETEFTIRLPSAVAGVLAIPLLVLLGAALKRPWAGLWAALLIAVLPFHLRYSQDARNYALLMTFSLATYILLVPALTRPRTWWWVAWGAVTALNLYTHFSALIVLAFEGVLIAVWLMGQFFHRRFKAMVGPTVGLLVAGILYIPWLPRLLLAFVDADACCDVIGSVSEFTPPMTAWIQNAYTAFGYDSSILPLLMAGLSVLGLVLLARQRDWLPLLLIVLGLVLAFLLIRLFDVARWPFPKYIIYLLPLYPIAAGVALDTLLGWVTQKLSAHSPLLRPGIPALVVLGLIAVTWPLLRQEHAYVQEDWKGITEQLSATAQEGDVFVSMALDLPNGFNQGAIVWPYYLDRTFESYIFLPSNQLRAVDVQELADTNADVWLVLLNRVLPVEFQEGTAEVTPFQNDLFLVRPTIEAASALDTTIAMYRQMIPMAVDPSPRCMLRHDLAAMYVVARDWAAAEEMAAGAVAACPGGEIPMVNRYLLLSQIYQGQLEEAPQRGQAAELASMEDKARRAAAQLLRLGVRDPAALRLLTMTDLIEAFVSGEARVSDAGAPEPVQVQRYVMPQDGDWSDVLFVHPGASISFRTVLPQEPAGLYFRAAMNPESWDWGGDGATFVVRVETDAGEARELYRKHVSNDAGDRRWHDELISLTEYSGQAVTLSFTTEPGPAGDYTGDWAGWGMPLIILNSK